MNDLIASLLYITSGLTVFIYSYVFITGTRLVFECIRSNKKINRDGINVAIVIVCSVLAVGTELTMIFTGPTNALLHTVVSLTMMGLGKVAVEFISQQTILYRYIKCNVKCDGSLFG